MSNIFNPNFESPLHHGDVEFMGGVETRARVVETTANLALSVIAGENWRVAQYWELQDTAEAQARDVLLSPGVAPLMAYSEAVPTAAEPTGQHAPYDKDARIEQFSQLASSEARDRAVYFRGAPGQSGQQSATQTPITENILDDTQPEDPAYAREVFGKVA